MRLVPNSASIVIAGIWNPAILSPPWLLRLIHEVPVGENRPVLLEQPLVAAGQPPHYTIDGIKYSPARNQLVIQPASDTPTREELARTQEMSLRILRQLPHTPIIGIGFNFSFMEENPTQTQLAVFTSVSDLAEHCDFEFETRKTGIVSTIQFDNRTLNLLRTNEGGQLLIQFNYHYELGSGQEAATKLETPLFVENFDYSRRILNSVYGVELDLQQAAAPQPQPQAQPA